VVRREELPKVVWHSQLAKSMLVVLAPILTYTIDEVLEYAPKIVKDDAEDVFDLVKKEFYKC